MIDVLTEGDVYSWTDPYDSSRTLRLTATGTRREIKEVLFDFFLAEDGQCLFFSPEEVETQMKKVS